MNQKLRDRLDKGPPMDLRSGDQATSTFWTAAYGLLLLQEGDERWDICEVDDCAAINICFGLENTGLQD